MMPPNFTLILIIVVCCTALLILGLFLLTRFNRLFKQQIKNELVRKNLVVWLTALCIILSISPTTIDFYSAIAQHKLVDFYIFECIGITIEVLLVFNFAWWLSRSLEKRQASFRKRMIAILCVIIAGAVVMSVPSNYFGNKLLGKGPSLENIQYTVLFTIYSACMTGFVVITMNYVDLERKRKLNEKELEVSRLRELKTKAELDALHSKINPHFLYNALNSIADLSLTDGKKARKMTIALADLFRYSINYSNHNYSSVREEIEMAQVYLEIEKIRFEDRLNYSIRMSDDVAHYLVPRFMLQPVVENAVKHALKATGKITEIAIDVKNGNGTLELNIADNGPSFPDDLIPGYGVKSIYDKLDLLFPGNYEIHFNNHPRKKVSIYIHKLLKNESNL